MFGHCHSHNFYPSLSKRILFGDRSSNKTVTGTGWRNVGALPTRRAVQQSEPSVLAGHPRHICVGQCVAVASGGRSVNSAAAHWIHTVGSTTRESGLACQPGQHRQGPQVSYVA